MIYFYSGTPGSGKSLHVARDIYIKLKIKKENVIANFPIAVDYISRNGKRKIGNFIYKDYKDMTVEFLIEYAKQNHVLGKESQTLVVIDECQIIFNPREYNTRDDRMKWINFFTRHRKFGYNFILISQFDRLVDRQIRSLFEYEIKHRKVNNFGIGMLFPFKTFVAVNYWYGVKEKISVEFFIYRHKYSKIYDSFMYFECNENENAENNEGLLPVQTEMGGARLRGGPIGVCTAIILKLKSFLEAKTNQKMKIKLTKKRGKKAEKKEPSILI